MDSSTTQPTIDEYRNTNEQIQQPIVLHHSSSIENSDLYFTDYVLMQYLGESPDEGEQESEEDYQTKLGWGWTEIILDDFS